jgi:hypothetical protein
MADPSELLLIPSSPTGPTPSTPSLPTSSDPKDSLNNTAPTPNGVANSPSGTGTASPSGNGNGKDKDKDKKHLVIEEKTYFAVAATLGSVELLVDYIKIVLNIEMLTTDVMSRIIEYLKVRVLHFASLSPTIQRLPIKLTRMTFDGTAARRSPSTLERVKSSSARVRCVQLVSRTSPRSISVGLPLLFLPSLRSKTSLISRFVALRLNLALASQSLSVMIALIPYIRETLRRHLNPKQAVMLVEFDRLKRVRLPNLLTIPSLSDRY